MLRHLPIENWSCMSEVYMDKVQHLWRVQIPTLWTNCFFKPCNSESTCNMLGVSKNRGTPKCMVYNGKPYYNGCLGVPLFLETPMLVNEVASTLLSMHGFRRISTYPLHTSTWISSQATVKRLFQTWGLLQVPDKHHQNKVDVHLKATFVYNRRKRTMIRPWKETLETASKNMLEVGQFFGYR